MLHLTDSPFPAHLLAAILLLTGLAGIVVQLIHRRLRENLFLAARPGSIAAAVSLTSQSPFRKLLDPHDNDETMRRKLERLRFSFDRSTGAIVATEDIAGGHSPVFSDGVPSEDDHDGQTPAALEHLTLAGYPPLTHDPLKETVTS